MKIKTAKFQEMLSRSIKGVGNNKLIPLTSMLEIQVNNEVLSLTTTNATNYLTVTDKLDSEDLYAVVNCDQFTKLISKLNCEFVTLELQEPSLKIIGNGTYLLDLQYDESNNMVKFPDNQFIAAEEHTIKLTTVKNILLNCKSALATTLEIPVYTGYYIADKVIATDTYKINELNSKVFDKPVLLSSEIMDLLDVFTDEDIVVGFKDDSIYFKSSDCLVTGRIMAGIEDFAIEPISGLLNQEFANICEVERNKLLSALDRVSLFVGLYDNQGVKLIFDKDRLTVESMKSNGIEEVPYITKLDCEPFSCLINVNILVEQLKSNITNTVNIHFGESNAIKLTSGNLIQVVALLEQ